MSTSLDGPVGRLASLFDVDVGRTTLVVVAMLGLDALWWVVLFEGHVPMPGMSWLMAQGIPMAAPGAMERGVAHVGTLRALGGYVVMWGVMMWAMMLPAMVRFVRDYSAAHRGSAREAATAVVGFLGGYKFVWALSAVVPLTVDALAPGGIYGVVRSDPRLVLGSVFVLTGLYQLSAFKQGLLRDCCTHVEAHGDGLPESLTRGLDHGVDCVLICLALFFAVMPAVGEMNYVWMVALTGVVTMERLPRWGREVAVATGVVSLLAGLVVLLADPALPVAFETAM